MGVQFVVAVKCSRIRFSFLELVDDRLLVVADDAGNLKLGDFFLVLRNDGFGELNRHGIFSIVDGCGRWHLDMDRS